MNQDNNISINNNEKVHLIKYLVLK